MNIRVLDPRVAQQVAAGEVVDRPASVVKELAENALDAGASHVEVELGDGGTSRILVRDDGSGMPKEDAALSVLRHATSKIRTVGDLETVVTFGFRGKALASMASVSSFSLTTSTGENGTSGTRVAVEGGGEAEVSAASHPKGTTVLLDRLFYNVPARRTFLKGPRTERAAVVEVVTHLAVAHPEVAFRLTEKGREHLSLPKARDLLERLAQVHGFAKARAMRPVEHESESFKVSGYAALPSVTESSRSSQTISVNGRWVRAESLTRGIDDAYRATLPSGRYPPVALRMEVDPRKVDLNVHPTKQIVRFSEEKEARTAVAYTVRAAIGREEANGGAADEPPAAPRGERVEKEAQRAETAPSPVARAETAASPYLANGSAASHRARGGSGVTVSPKGPSPRDVPRLDEAREKIREASAPLLEALEQGRGSGDGETAPPTPSGVPERGALPRLEALRIVGQVAVGYVLVEEPGSLWVVDQHVAHERTVLDGLTDPEEGSAPTVQPLLVPEVVELPLGEAAEASEYLEELAVYGFEAEPFGPTSFRITGVISTLAERDVGGAFKDALSAARGIGAGHGREERILATIACHSSVRLGDRLSHAEMEELIRGWLTSRFPATCPHGRSICYRIGTDEIARKLDRH